MNPVASGVKLDVIRVRVESRCSETPQEFGEEYVPELDIYFFYPGHFLYFKVYRVTSPPPYSGSKLPVLGLRL